MAKVRKHNIVASSRPPSAQGRQHELQMAAHAESYEGPMPHPAMLAEYDALIPGAGERLLRIVEPEGEHRRALELKAASETFAYRKRGQFTGTLAMLGMIGISAYALFAGAPWVAVTALGTTTALVGVFVLRKAPPRKAPATT